MRDPGICLLDYLKPVLAPAAGRVLRVLEESERVVLAGTPIVEIGDARYRVVFGDLQAETVDGRELLELEGRR